MSFRPNWPKSSHPSIVIVRLDENPQIRCAVGIWQIELSSFRHCGGEESGLVCCLSLRPGRGFGRIQLLTLLLVNCTPNQHQSKPSRRD